MSPVLMNLGSFQFSLDTAVFDELRRSTTYNWPEQSRIGTTAAIQFTGQDAETITLPGRIYPHFRGGLGQVDAMRSMAQAGKPLLLVDGLGSIKGFWSITRIDECRKVLWSSGAPRLQEFTIDLKYYGPNGNDVQPRAYSAVQAAVGSAQPSRLTRHSSRVPSRGSVRRSSKPALKTPNRLTHQAIFPLGVFETPIGPIRLPIPNISIPIHPPGLISTAIGPVRFPNFTPDLPAPL